MKPTFKFSRTSRIAISHELSDKIDKIHVAATSISAEIVGGTSMLHKIHEVVSQPKPIDFANILAKVFAHLPGFSKIKDEKSFLKEVATEKSRNELAKKSGINKDTILRFANIIDLKRIEGVDEKTAILLEAAGVDSPFELKKRIAENLEKSIKNTITEKGLDIDVPPTTDQINQWKESVATNDKIIYHGSEKPQVSANDK